MEAHPSLLERIKAAFACVDTALDGLKGSLTRIAAVVLVVPSLATAGYQAYASLSGKPKTAAQADNQRLFVKYFNKQPLVTIPVTVKQERGAVQALFSVYDEGDVYVEYGQSTQWFPFPRPLAPPALPLALIGTAHAQAPAAPPAKLDAPRAAAQFQQSERMEDNYLLRTRRWDNGMVEDSRIDVRTGAIVEHRTRQEAPLKLEGEKSRVIGATQQPLQAIDLKRLRAARGKALEAEAGK
ncbi:hypothetical protein [Pseudoduganella violacea]|uniref:Uncharacterized protein n=1 Tax=Pseudoduganella violacea TaxID=1715466 RepID=A0A7W5FVJ1_9BURK|nr:hypothetical protein [Pseudoduganella violacea]MBB3121055.1 hypothetical protein [Pseudoduganella violacea]